MKETLALPLLMGGLVILILPVLIMAGLLATVALLLSLLLPLKLIGVTVFRRT